MSVRVKLYYRTPSGLELIYPEPESGDLIPAIETILDDMAATVHEMGGIDAYRELLIRVENVSE